jgi:plasmid stability protein
MSVSITIRDTDETTTRWINEEAARRGISVELLVVEIIHKGISIERESSQLHTYHDLDSLAGTWSDEQATDFLNAVAAFEYVDEKLWQ